MRYTVEPAFWSLLALWRISQTQLAAVTGTSQQWVSRLYHEPHLTVSAAWARAAAAHLRVPLDRVFTPVLSPPQAQAA